MSGQRDLVRLSLACTKASVLADRGERDPADRGAGAKEHGIADVRRSSARVVPPSRRFRSGGGGRRKQPVAVPRKVAACRPSTADRAAVEERRKELERDRWELRDKLRTVSWLDRQQICGLPRDNTGGVPITVRLTEHDMAATATGYRKARMVGFSGLFTCGNVWSCPQCSRKISAARATELERVMGYYVEKGGYVVLVTLTLRHRHGQRLDVLWDAVAQAWDAVTKARAWRKDKKDLKLAGWVRATEVTCGCNGWHPHLHVPLIFHSKPDPSDITEMARRMFDRWRDRLVKLGLDAPDRDHHGLDIQFLDYYEAAKGCGFDSKAAFAQYVCKGLSMETTFGGQKQAKNGNRTMTRLLRDALMPYDMHVPDGTAVEDLDDVALELWHEHDLALWHEYEEASRGRRQVEWCRDKDFQAVRKELAPTADQSNQDIAAEEVGDRQDDVAVIPLLSWYQIVGRAVELKQATEDGGVEACWAWLDAAGVEWWRPNSRTDVQVVVSDRRSVVGGQLALTLKCQKGVDS
jgi:hypothetical protein